MRRSRKVGIKPHEILRNRLEATRLSARSVAKSFGKLAASSAAADEAAVKLLKYCLLAFIPRYLYPLHLHPPHQSIRNDQINQKLLVHDG